MVGEEWWDKNQSVLEEKTRLADTVVEGAEVDLF